MQRRVYGGIEGGGTKFNCMIGTDPDHVLAPPYTIPTTDPQSTLDAVVRFFQQALQDHKDVELAAVGVGSFGPIDLNPASATYGYITTTPKPGWQYTDIVSSLKKRLGVPIVALDTDVNAAALGEYRWGAAQGSDPSVYITVGTGIGGGIYVNGAPLHGLIHPEMGHLQLPRLDDDDFSGVCPYHTHCWEGMASGPAIAARVGKPAHYLPSDHPVWEIEAHNLAMGITSIMYITSPYRIILGGGVMRQEHLFPRIRYYVQKILNGYLNHKAVLDDIASFIVPPKLGSRAGLFGALELARLAEAKQRTQ